MSVRTYLDHNFFHHAHEWLLGPERDALVRSFTSHRYSLYASGESISEMIALWGTRRSARLQPQAQLLLETMSGRTLRYHGKLVTDELRGVQSSLFLPATQSERLKTLLSILASGGTPTGIEDIVKHTRERKNDDERVWDDMKATFSGLEQANKHGWPPPFEEVRDEWAIDQLDCFFDACERNGKLARPAATASEIIASPERYPYTVTAFRTWAALSYRHWVENRTVERGDTFDAQQVIYLVGVDLLVSDDANMQALCQRVHGSRVRIVTRREFLEEVSAGSQIPEAAH